MKESDRKKLWGRSGNICSFPGCYEELAPGHMSNRVLGEEAHIKGEKSTSARYDPTQSRVERDSYDNHILLCPNHHTVIDEDPNRWTVESIQQMKLKHEIQVMQNQRHPRVLGALRQAVRQFTVSQDNLEILVNEIIEGEASISTFQVDAALEGGSNSGIKVSPGQKLIFFARGLVTYDGGYHFTTPEGILCNDYGLPLSINNDSNNTPVVWPHEHAYKTDGGRLGLIGSLFGWIKEYSEGKAFFIGSKREIDVQEEGYLYLAINDAKGTFADNEGAYRVDVKLVQKDQEPYGVVERPYWGPSPRNSAITIDPKQIVGPSGEVSQEFKIVPVKDSKGPQGPIEDE